MKKILITGTNSYVGNALKIWLSNYEKDCQIINLDVKNPDWRKFDFSIIDTIVHIAAIVHRKETKKNKSLYFEVNRDLTIEIANLAKKAKVKQFVFMSSMSVFGVNKGEINLMTPIKPTSYYGKSKAEAETQLQKLASDDFIISIIRAPMIYGKNCKGNYKRLSQFARKTFIFPNIKCKRSVLYINNLCELIRILIINKIQGVFHPQNSEYVSTTEIVKLIAKLNNKKIWFTKIFNIFIKCFNIKILSKMFNDLYYAKEISSFELDYNITNFEDSIKETEELKLK